MSISAAEVWSKVGQIIPHRRLFMERPMVDPQVGWHDMTWQKWTRPPTVVDN